MRKLLCYYAMHNNLRIIHHLELNINTSIFFLQKKASKETVKKLHFSTHHIGTLPSITPTGNLLVVELVKMSNPSERSW